MSRSPEFSFQNPEPSNIAPEPTLLDEAETEELRQLRITRTNLGINQTLTPEQSSRIRELEAKKSGQGLQPLTPDELARMRGLNRKTISQGITKDEAKELHILNERMRTSGT
jgi:hypothetical protein